MVDDISDRVEFQVQLVAWLLGVRRVGAEVREVKLALVEGRDAGTGLRGVVAIKIVIRGGGGGWIGELELSCVGVRVPHACVHYACVRTHVRARALGLSQG